MKWKLSDYIYKVRKRLEEFESDYYSDVEIMDYVNEGIGELREALNLEESLTAYVSDSNEIVLPDDIYKIRVVFLDDQRVDYVTVNERTQARKSCYVYGGTLYFSQKQTGKVEVFYLRYPTVMEDTSEESDVPVVYQNLPVLYAVARCFEKDKNEDNANYYFGQFEDKKQKMLNDNRDKFDHLGVTYVRNDDEAGGW